MMDGVILLNVTMVMTLVQYAPRQVSNRGNRLQIKLSYETCSCVCALVISFSNLEVLESRNGGGPSFGLFEYQIKLPPKLFRNAKTSQFCRRSPVAAHLWLIDGSTNQIAALPFVHRYRTLEEFC